MARDFDAIRKQFDIDKSEESDVRKEAAIDQKFVAGGDGQWDEKALKQRRDNGRPALSFNRLDGPVNIVANEARQNKPSIKFSPSDDPADKETAEILEGLARAVQYDSDADTAYETALRCSSGNSFGYFRLTTEYCDWDSFDLDLKVKTVIDPFSIYGILIPSCLGQKARHAFVLESITHDDYTRKYGDSQLSREGFGSEFAKQGDLWVSSNRVQIAEYWEITSKRVQIALLDDGRVVTGDDLKQLGDTKPRMVRTTEQETITSCLTNGLEVLGDSETVWPGTCIPIFLVPGEVQIVDGKVRLHSVIRFSRDPQQLLNFAKSRLAELLGAQPISPWLVEEGQLGGHETAWNEAHIKPTAVLYYKGKDENGLSYAGAPHRNSVEPPIMALSNFIAQESDDIKATSKHYDAALGAQSNEQSGRAINARTHQSSLANLHFIDNLKRTHRTAGREIGIVIQKTYDGARQARILGVDETEKKVWLNKEFQDPETGETKMYDLSAGKYDIRVSSEPGYTTRREEAFLLLTDLARAYPQLMELIGDIIMRNSNIPGADEAAERMKKMLPPQLQEGEQPAEISPEVQAQLQQAEQIVHQLEAQLQATQQQADTNASKERIELAKLEAQKQQKAAEIDLQRETALINADLEKQKLDLEQRKLDLEASKLELERMKAVMAAAAPDPTTLPENGLPIAA